MKTTSGWMWSGFLDESSPGPPAMTAMKPYASVLRSAAVCGDGVRTGYEKCDDGNKRNGDGCADNCQIETYWQCKRDPVTKRDACGPLCGDGRTLPGEQCDDGNLKNGDGCSSTCKIEQGWYCPRREDF